MSHGNDIGDWRVIDPRPGVPLTDIFPYSDRARALIFRKSTNPILHTNFLQVRGAVSILGGLDYHRDRFVEIIGQLVAGKLKRDAPAMHEAVAYVNRAGQFYYFANSDLVKAQGVRPPIPVLEDVMHFRHKYTAHRSVDYPRPSDTDVLQAYQAMSMGDFDGRYFEPREGQAIRPDEVPWKYGYLVFQIGDHEGKFHFLNIERDHHLLMEEAYKVLEFVLK